MGTNNSILKRRRSMEKLLDNDQKLALTELRVVVLGLGNKYLIEKLIEYYETIDCFNNNYGESVIEELSWHSNSDRSDHHSIDHLKYTDNEYMILINGYFRILKTSNSLSNNITLLIREYYISSLVKSYKIRINNKIYDIWNLSSMTSSVNNNNNKLYLSYCKKAMGVITVHYKMNECTSSIETTQKTIKSILTMTDDQGNNIYIGSNNIGHQLVEPYYHSWFNHL